MAPTNRREILKWMAGAPVAAAGVAISPAAAQRAHQHAAQSVQNPEEASGPQFFSEHEFETVKVLADWVIPADSRSPSASQVGVPEFIDFIMVDRPQHQVTIRGGLALLDHECAGRFDAPFRDCSEAQQQEILDAIAYPDKAAPEHSHLVRFFNAFRDLTASGFWTTREGMDDLQYLGNTFVDEWKGCPPEALQHLGLSGEDAE